MLTDSLTPPAGLSASRPTTSPAFPSASAFRASSRVLVHQARAGPTSSSRGGTPLISPRNHSADSAQSLRNLLRWSTDVVAWSRANHIPRSAEAYILSRSPPGPSKGTTSGSSGRATIASGFFSINSRSLTKLVNMNDP